MALRSETEIHPEMQIRSLLCNKGAIFEHDPVMRPVFSEGISLLRNHGYHIYWTEEGRGSLVCQQHSVQKPTSLMVRIVH